MDGVGGVWYEIGKSFWEDFFRQETWFSSFHIFLHNSSAEFQYESCIKKGSEISSKYLVVLITPVDFIQGSFVVCLF